MQTFPLYFIFTSPISLKRKKIPTFIFFTRIHHSSFITNIPKIFKQYHNTRFIIPTKMSTFACNMVFAACSLTFMLGIIGDSSRFIQAQSQTQTQVSLFPLHTFFGCVLDYGMYQMKSQDNALNENLSCLTRLVFLSLERFCLFPSFFKYFTDWIGLDSIVNEQ